MPNERTALRHFEALIHRGTRQYWISTVLFCPHWTGQAMDLASMMWTFCNAIDFANSRELSTTLLPLTISTASMTGKGRNNMLRPQQSTLHAAPCVFGVSLTTQQLLE